MSDDQLPPADDPKATQEAIEFMRMICSHFQTLTDTLRDIVGSDVFGQKCCMILGYVNEFDNGGRAIEMRATGNLRISISTCAMVLRLAAKEMAKKYDQSEEECLMRVLEDLKKDVLSIQAQVPPES